MRSADLGGREGFGPVVVEADEPVFHASWEREAFALTLAMGATGLWTLDAARDRRETLPPAQYLATPYYGIWLAALERLLAERGVLADDGPEATPLAAQAVRSRMAAGGPTSRPGPAPAYAVGDLVAVRRGRPARHCRIPTYLRGAVGTVIAHHGCHVFPDSNAHDEGERPQPLYTIAFAAAELWGPDTSASEVCADLFEPYLEPVA